MKKKTMTWLIASIMMMMMMIILESIMAKKKTKILGMDFFIDKKTIHSHKFVVYKMSIYGNIHGWP